MVQATFLEQLQTLGNILISNPYVFYIALIAIGSILILELSNKFKSKKIVKILCLTVYFVVFGTLLFFFHEQIFTLIDYLINNIFILLFFPNLAFYTLVILVINIILIKSIIKDKKSIKHMNIVFFVVFNIIFYLIIDNIIKNNINIYEQLSIYTNNELLILIELSMKLFLIWLVLLLIIKITNKLSLSFVHTKQVNLAFEPVVNDKELETIKTIDNKQEKLEKVLDVNNNTLILENKEIPEYVDIKPVNNYNNYIDIEPIKKRKEYTLLNMDNMFIEENLLDKSDMDKVFKNNYIEAIMNDIEKLKYNHTDKNQIQKVYDEIILSEKDLTLDDYNVLIHKLSEIKNNY